MVFFGADDNRLYALQPSGALNWSFETGAEILSSPSISTDGRIVFGSLDSRLYSLSSPGALVWSYEAESPLFSSPALASDGEVYFGVGFSWGDDGLVYALTSAGVFSWVYETDNYVNSSPAVGTDGTVYIGSIDNTLYALHGEAPPVAPPVQVNFQPPAAFPPPNIPIIDIGEGYGYRGRDWGW